MVIKDKERADRLIRSAKAIQKDPHMIVLLPMWMDKLKRDRGVLASVWALDDWAIVVPGTRRCGILMVKWWKFRRFMWRRANILVED